MHIYTKKLKAKLKISPHTERLRADPGASFPGVLREHFSSVRGKTQLAKFRAGFKVAFGSLRQRVIRPNFKHNKPENYGIQLETGNTTTGNAL